MLKWAVGVTMMVTCMMIVANLTMVLKGVCAVCANAVVMIILAYAGIAE